MWLTEDARGGPGRARSVAEGRERDDFWIQESVGRNFFHFFAFLRVKFENQLGKKGVVR